MIIRNLDGSPRVPELRWPPAGAHRLISVKSQGREGRWSRAPVIALAVRRALETRGTSLPRPGAPWLAGERRGQGSSWPGRNGPSGYRPSSSPWCSVYESAASPVQFTLSVLFFLRQLQRELLPEDHCWHRRQTQLVLYIDPAPTTLQTPLPVLCAWIPSDALYERSCLLGAGSVFLCSLGLLCIPPAQRLHSALQDDTGAAWSPGSSARSSSQGGSVGLPPPSPRWPAGVPSSPVSC